MSLSLTIGRARKVKCDERFPACHRCVSTGRVCDGYGIWGGGGNSYGERYAKAQSNSPPDSSTLTVPIVPRVPSRPGLSNASERAYFDWFHGQSAGKWPGIFGSGFWDTLVLQASVSEPAILHAVLALSCAHRSSSIAGSTRRSLTSASPDKHEQFCLRQYSSAISGLKPHFMSNSKASIRVALIACIVFTCLEFVRGHYQTGKNHFYNGLRLLGQLRVLSGNAHLTECPSMSKSEQSVDNWLAEQFARLHLQARLFGQKPISSPTATPERFPVQPVSFNSPSHARKCLDQLISKTSALAERHRASRPHTLPSADTLQQQARIQHALAAWHAAYEASATPAVKRDIVSAMGYKILHSYYLVAHVTASTCLRLDGEMAFDCFTDDFRTIMRNSFQLGEIVFNDGPGTKWEHNPAVPPIVADMGWITPLYFVALKCRVREVRMEAVRFLEHGDCKEGIWDAALAASVAREVMAIEEEGLGRADSVGCGKAEMDEEDAKMPPERNRIHDVEIVLPEGPEGELGIVCKRRVGEGQVETIERYRDAISRKWSGRKV